MPLIVGNGDLTGDDPESHVAVPAGGSGEQEQGLTGSGLCDAEPFVAERASARELSGAPAHAISPSRENRSGEFRDAVAHPVWYLPL